MDPLSQGLLGAGLAGAISKSKNLKKALLCGFVSGLAEGLSLYDSMRRGTALASFCIEDFGLTRLLDISLDELDHRIKSIE